jgi:HEAT repeat protein
MSASGLKGMGPGAVPAIVPLLKDPSVDIRKTAAEVLGDIGPDAKAAVGALNEALADSDPDVRLKITTALGKIEPGRAGRQAAELIAGLKDKDPKVRRNAAESLGKLGRPEAGVVDALAGALQDKDFSVQLAVVSALEKLGPAAVPVLQKALQHRDKFVRQNAITALGNMSAGAAPALPAVRAALQDSELDVRMAAGEALTKLDPATPLDALVTELSKQLEGKDEQDCQKALTALGKLGPSAKASVPTLIKVVKSGTPPQRKEAVEALGKIGPAARDAVPALIDALKDKETDKKLSADSALPFLRAFATFRAAAADALGQIGPDARSAVPALLEVIKETKPKAGGVIVLENATLYEAATEAVKKIDPMAASAAGIR